MHIHSMEVGLALDGCLLGWLVRCGMSCEGDKRPRVSGSVRKGRLVKHGV